LGRRGNLAPLENRVKRIALIHDWLTGMRGGEKVLEVLADLFPRADIFTLVHIPGRVSPAIERHKIMTSPIQHIPGIGRYYRHLLPILPWAIESLDFSGYDLLISTSHCVAKGAIPSAGVPHWCYNHTPMRYIWDQYDQYFAPGRASWPVRTAMAAVRPYLQRWDLNTLPRVTHFLANSENVQARIQRLYHRDSEVVYPPVDFDFYAAEPLLAAADKSDFYLVVSALAPYKRIDLALDACARKGKRLIVIGEGQESASLQSRAGKDVQFLGWRSGAELRDYFRRAKALLFPGEEDFGIVPLEAMAAGCPVIALGKGGALETVVEGKTGYFFPEPTIDSLVEAMNRLELTPLDSAQVRDHAERFSKTHCETSFRRLFIEYQSEMS
jgi:glycosyltransferase involved in cell wall biosynthesis